MMIRINRHKLAVLSGILCFFISCLSLYAVESTEYQVKGAMIMNFIRFVQWPEKTLDATDDRITIGIMGSNDFDNAFEPIDGRVVAGKSLTVKYIHSIYELSGCQVLFVSASERHRLKEILESVDHQPILTIGEVEDFTRLGGIIRFYFDQNHIRFAISRTAASRSPLKLSAKLYEIAKVVN